MDRLISEQAVIDAVSEWLYDKTRKESIETVIKAIPSAEPKTVPIAVIRFDDDKLQEMVEEAVKNIEIEPKWIPVSERLPKEDGDYFVTYEKGYAEDYNFTPIGIVRFEVDCESFGYWHEYFDRQTLGSLGSEWEEIKVIAWMPLPKPYEPQEKRCEDCNHYGKFSLDCARCDDDCSMYEPQEISDHNLKMWKEIYAEEKRREGSEE